MGRLYVLAIVIVITAGHVQRCDGYKFSQSCVLNRSCKLPCLMEPYERNVTVFWYNSRGEILSRGTQIEDNDLNLKIEKPAENEWVLHMLAVKKDLDDKYICKTDRTILSEVTVFIEHKPRLDQVRSSKPHVEIQEGRDANLTCVFSGLPEPEIEWYRGRQYDEKIEGLTGAMLIIRNVTRYASDTYNCKGSNKHGSDEGRIRLVTKFAPEVTVMPTVIQSVINEKIIVMRCIVQASPLYKVYWTDKTGGKIEGKEWKYEFKEETVNEYMVRFLQLQISFIEKGDEGNYTCHGIGDTSAQASIKLEIQEHRVATATTSAAKTTATIAPSSSTSSTASTINSNIPENDDND